MRSIRNKISAARKRELSEKKTLTIGDLRMLLKECMGVFREQEGRKYWNARDKGFSREVDYRVVNL